MFPSHEALARQSASGEAVSFSTVEPAQLEKSEEGWELGGWQAPGQMTPGPDPGKSMTVSAG